MSIEKNDLTTIQFKIDKPNTRIMSRKTDTKVTSTPDIVFETIHSDDNENNFVFTFINADTFITTTYSADSENSPKNYQQLHYHDFFELIYIISGSMYQQIETERHLYTSGSLCLLNCFISHQEEYSTDFRALFLRLPISLMKSLLDDINTLFFDMERAYGNQLFEQFFTDSFGYTETTYVLRKEYIDFIPNENAPEIKQHMYGFFDSLTLQLANPVIGSTYIIKGLIIQILCELSDSSKYQIIPLNIGTDSEIVLFNAIREQIQKSCGHISRKELEDNLSYSGSYLNRIIRKYSGYSLKQFALSVSLNKAVDLLQNTNMSINEICDYLQFSNQTYFYSSFQKKYGLTPKKYRENYRNSLGKS
ncbi:AraC family transcriptional regulator [Anaerobium acetethylicum]|uniref:AraC-type DNA-binding protein n=1 Tax=Anaerobium acetethylicum TaxID=1619234 RepID=A0A1D3TX13_9FIRM|nr:helix-turn-helix domain-containing protein [Anaerobium acetethylicum]SCP98830.1 AraC-type DNA-binding protein [Anaerobium acetethylicum]